MPASLFEGNMMFDLDNGLLGFSIEYAILIVLCIVFGYMLAPLILEFIH